MHLTGQEMIIKRATSMMENNFRDIEKAAEFLQSLFLSCVVSAKNLQMLFIFGRNISELQLGL